MARRPVKLPINTEHFLSIIAGTEGGIATTAAIVSGLVIGTDDRNLVIVSTLVAILVQAFNSSITTVMTSHILDEIEKNRDMDSLFGPITQAAAQFFTHVASGLIVLLPIIYVPGLHVALLYSIAVALVMLAWVGLFIGVIVRNGPLRNSIQSFVLGVMIICGGLAAGTFVN